MHPAEDRDQWQAVVSTVINLQVPQKVENFLTSCVTVSSSRRALLHVVSVFVHLLVHCCIGWLVG